MTPILTTSRLRLRPPKKSDFANIYRLGSDPKVMEYISNGRTQTRMEARRDLAKRIKLSEGDYGYWITEELETNDFIGWTALKKLDRSDDFEIGYRLLRDKWGKGYATEAASCLLEYGFETLKLNEIIAVSMPQNTASRRVLEKIGLKYKGTGTFYNTFCVIYQLGIEEYENQSLNQNSNSNSNSN